MLTTEPAKEQSSLAYNVKVRLKDTGVNLSDAAELTITVNEFPHDNNPPQVVNLPAAKTFRVAEPFDYTLTVTSGASPILSDAENNEITHTLSGNPPFIIVQS